MKISTCKIIPYFEKNMGQLLDDAKYKVKLNDYITFFTEDKLVVSLPSNKENTRNIFAMKLENANNDVEIKGEDELIGKINYLIGNNQLKWITKVPTYSKIKYEDVYENIDLYYYINNEKLEYDFVLSKGANPKDISLSFEGLDNIEIDENANIILTIGDIGAKLLKPQVYQVIENKKVYIDCEYKLDENNLVKFLIDEYEKEYDLVLDPVLTLDYSTYIGGYNDDLGRGIDIDSSGGVYIVGETESYDYPTTLGAYQRTLSGSSNIFVSKLSQDGGYLVYSTYIGGSGGAIGYAISVDSSGYAYICGSAGSNYPTTLGAYKTTSIDNTVVVTKLNKDGASLIYSTYIGNGGQYAYAVAIDSSGYAYITGTTLGAYPVTSGAYQTTSKGSYEAFVTKLSTDGKSLVYSTYLGGSSNDQGNGIAVDSSGYAYVSGYTTSTNFPVTSGAYQTTSKGGDDAFVTKLAADGKSLVYSTYLGGTGSERANAIAVDNKGYAYVVGNTGSSNFPVTSSSYQTMNKGSNDAFVTKLALDGKSLVYSTYLGGMYYDCAYGIDIDSTGLIYVTGVTSSIDFPTTSNAYQTISADNNDVFVTKLSSDLSELIYSTFIRGSNSDVARGIKVDNTGCAYVVGYSYSNDFPTTQESYQSSCPGETGVYNAFVSKISYVEYELISNYSYESMKLLDEITTSLSIKNVSGMDLDISIKYEIDDSSVYFVEDSLYIQNIQQSTSSIPSPIYIAKFPAGESARVRLDLKYKDDIYPNNIPIRVSVEIFNSNQSSSSLVYSTTKTFYLNTVIGANYIPGCNEELYNLEIDGKLQTTSSGIPIIYYKSGNSYIYIEPSGEKYVYNKLSNQTGVVEYLIATTPIATKTMSEIRNEEYISYTSYSAYIDLMYNYSPYKLKLLDIATTSLTIKNISKINLDFKIAYQVSNSSIYFVPNSLYIQNIRQYSNTILSPIYFGSILPQESINIKLDFKYVYESLENIPYTVTIELFDSSTSTPTLLYLIKRTLYINTHVGSNYIPGCNKNLYTISINGELQTTEDGMPIVYYKSGTSYIYRNPSTSKYVYLVLSGQENVVEYPIQRV